LPDMYQCIYTKVCKVMRPSFTHCKPHPRSGPVMVNEKDDQDFCSLRGCALIGGFGHQADCVRVENVLTYEQALACGMNAEDLKP